VPGYLVTIAPTLIGAPVAFWPLPRPHFEASAEELVVALPGSLALVAVELLLVPPSSPPQAARTTETQTSVSATASRGWKLITDDAKRTPRARLFTACRSLSYPRRDAKGGQEATSCVRASTPRSHRSDVVTCMSAAASARGRSRDANAW
jgi:hypothetical protein